MDDQNLRLEFITDLAVITFDQPNSKANTLSSATWNQLADAVAKAQAKAGIQGLILRSGKEGMFLAGADLKELDSLPRDNPEPTRSILQLGHRVLMMLEASPFPTVAAIDGACLGGGLEVALACDYRICGMHPKIKIGLPEVKLALIPGWGGTQRLPRILGYATSMSLLISGKAMTANEAWQFGLVDAIHGSEDLFESSVRCLRQAPVEEWRQRRADKQKPVKLDANTSFEQQIAVLPVEEQAAARVALQVVHQGGPLPLSDGCNLEIEAFIPLLAADAARGKLAGFLKK
jgi:enoyl-CoA hydratase/carnithine racemase